jgi:hypothetical protein
MDPNAAAPARPLDDIMIAMDVVDTLRHDKRILERELNDDARRAELIDRLRELYRSQGIEVPDSILEEGVRALEEKRFVYSPPDGSLEVRLARLYVTRDRWKPWVLGMAFLAFAALSTWYLLYERPHAAEQAAITQELEQDLPKKLTTLSAQIAKESTSEAVVKEAREIAESAASAASQRFWMRSDVSLI